MVSIIKKSNAYGVKHYILDTEQDFNQIPKASLFMGCTAFVISTGKRYVVDGKMEWTLVTSSGGGSGEDDPGEDEDTVIVYDGGEVLG